MKNLFDFGKAYGFGLEALEDEELEVTETVEEAPEVDEEVSEDVSVDGGDMNTQELQEEIPQVIDTDDVTNVVDDLGDTFEEGNDERPVGDIDYMPEELKAEIDAIEAMADQHAQVGEDVMMPEEPIHEVPGGFSLTEDAPVQGVDEVAEYAASINEVNVTGNQGDMDDYMRAEYNEDGRTEDSITDGTNNAETTVSSSDAAPIDADVAVNGNAMDDAQARSVEEVEVSSEDVDGEDTVDEAIGAKDVLGTESEDFEVEEEESEEDVEEPEESVDEEVEDSDDIEEVESTIDEDGNETCCAEELAILGELEVELNMDSTILTPEATEQAEQAAANTELEMTDDALAPVEEAQTINGPDEGDAAPMEDGSNEQDNVELNEDGMMSDVLGQVKEDSHGEDDSFYEGDFSVTSSEDDLVQISDGEASYDDEGSSDTSIDESVEESDDTEESMEEAENVVEEDEVEDAIDGDGDEIDTPEEAEAEVEEQTEDAVEDSEEVEDVEPESDDDDEE